VPRLARLVRPLVAAAALLGGMSWVANLWVDAVALSWVGSAALGLAVGVLGTGLARLVWVAAVAGLGTVVLGWALLAVARGLGEDRVVEAVLGAGATLLVGLLVLRGGEPEPSPVAPRRARPARPGNHRG
jgi:hypothetical protein